MIMDAEETKEPEEAIETNADSLKPKKPSNRAPEGIRAFTLCRQSDETGIIVALCIGSEAGQFIATTA